MGSAMLSGVSGLEAHQKMLDVSGDNLANINTTAYKAGRVSFSDLLSQTVREASQPTANSGGTNPMQIGSGVRVASIDRDMTQGSLVNTGQPLDMAVDGAGYFVLNDGQRDVYTRVGSFAVDANYYLVDPGTGHRVQRIGSEGVAEGFQDASSNSIRIPYDIALPAQSTTSVSFTGNLSADSSESTTNTLALSQALTTASGSVVSETTLLSSVTGATLAAGDTFQIKGTKADGAYVGGSATGVSYTVTSGSTVGDLLTAITNAFPGSTASLVNGEIRLTDDAAGYSQTMMAVTYQKSAGNTNGSFPLPTNTDVLTAGGDETKTINVQVFDAQGIGHTLSGTFVRRDTTNQWDLVVNSINGDVTMVDRRVNGIKFLADGSYGGIASVTGPDGQPTTDSASLKMIYASDPTNTLTVNLDMGTIGGFDGLSQFGGSSTVASSGQNGYASGWLSSLSVSTDGVLVGVFTNGARRNMAAIKMATFQNPEGLAAVGNNCFVSSTNSGDPVPTKALSGGAGGIQGGSLEKSNVDTAVEFVNLMEAQNGFQANARTIKVANEMLQQLTDLIR